MGKKKIDPFLNRELSWLNFNERVLLEAMSEETPLIERLNFFGIFSNNLDEFFRVRVAILNRIIRLEERIVDPELDFDPKTVLKQLQKRVAALQKVAEQTYDNIVFSLEKENVFIIDETEVTPEQGTYLRRYFKKEVRQHLFPLMLEQFKNFSILRDNSIYFIADLKHRDNKDDERYALIELPTNEISRFVTLPDDAEGRQYVILLDDLIRYCQEEIFSFLGYDKFKAYTIKFTRDAELDLDNDVSKSYLEIVSESLKQRKYGATVRFIYDQTMPKKMLEKVRKIFNIKKYDTVIKGGKYHNSKDFIKFPRSLKGSNLVYSPLPALYAKEFVDDISMLDTIRRQDVMLHYPYQSFQHIIDLLREASIDPAVRAIKMTIYRAAKDSRVINALINAARNGKKVTVYIELQARFDEEANIHWAGRMQEEGIDILPNIPGYKVHGKLLLIRRREEGQNRYYGIIGTGNPNENTSKIYADEHLLTADERITGEINKVFHFLEGKKYVHPDFSTLIVSPFATRDFFTRMIDREIANARDGKDAWMTIKLNNLVDKKIVTKMYEASAAGVNINLIIRGICVLVPGIKGQSENIHAIRIVDRFLEHSRIFVFCNEGKAEYFIGSADWMDRNFDHRIEVTVPVYDPNIQADLAEILRIQLSDNTKARIIDAKKSNAVIPEGDPQKPIRSQYEIYKFLKREDAPNL